MGRHREYDSWEQLIAAKTHVEGDCLIWDAGCHSQGYPMVRWDLKMIQVVRKQVEEATCQKLDGRRQRVKNRVCDNIKCVNPDHYIVADYGTQDWKCVGHTYDTETRNRIKEIYNNYQSPGGTKYGYQKVVKKEFPHMCATTITSIVFDRNYYAVKSKKKT